MNWPKLEALLNASSSHERNELLKEIPPTLLNSFANWWKEYLVSQINSSQLENFAWMKDIIWSYLEKYFNEWLCNARWNNMIDFAFYDIFITSLHTKLSHGPPLKWKWTIYTTLYFWNPSFSIHQRIFKSNNISLLDENHIIVMTKKWLNKTLNGSRNSCPFNKIWDDIKVFVDALWDFYTNEIIPVIIEKFWEDTCNNLKFIWLGSNHLET